MAVSKNPYKEWEAKKSTADYRSTETQLNSLTRQQMSKPSFLRSSNRVNPGPMRGLRAKVADSQPLLPHPLGSQDLWGWQPWPERKNNVSETHLADNLLKEDQVFTTPGADYSPFGEVGGATS